MNQNLNRNSCHHSSSRPKNKYSGYVDSRSRVGVPGSVSLCLLQFRPIPLHAFFNHKGESTKLLKWDFSEPSTKWTLLLIPQCHHNILHFSVWGCPVDLSKKVSRLTTTIQGRNWRIGWQCPASEPAKPCRWLHNLVVTVDLKSTWRGGRAADCTGLENRHVSNGIQGSNPCLSACFSAKTLVFTRVFAFLGVWAARRFSVIW